VDDVASAFASALTSHTSDVVLNIGSGEQSRLDVVARTIIEALGSTSAIEYTNDFRVGDIRAFSPALERSGSVIGYRPRVSLDRGVAEFAQWAATADGTETYDAADELMDRGLLRRVLEL
jgi:dTDP-L-rhamnose 4-epimerase